jgi:putative chitinase
MVTAEQLQKLKINTALVDAFNETFDRWGIKTMRQQAAFIGQCGHECANFTKLEEGLSYAADRLMKIWPRRFPNMEIAQKYARNPKALANYVYANRMGNRDEASGDGFRFRGSGWLQLTGHDNFYHAGKACGVDFVMNPDLVRTPKYAALTAGWYWATHNCNELAERGDNLALTKKINGGTIGLDDRIHHTNLALAQFDPSVTLA